VESWTQGHAAEQGKTETSGENKKTTGREDSALLKNGAIISRVADIYLSSQADPQFFANPILRTISFPKIIKGIAR